MSDGPDSLEHEMPESGPSPRFDLGASRSHLTLLAFRSTATRAGSIQSAAGLLGGALRSASLALARGYGHLLRSVSTRARFLDTDRIGWVADLEASWPVIRDEFDQLRRGFELPSLIDVIPGERAVTDEHWRMFFLNYAGRTMRRKREL